MPNPAEAKTLTGHCPHIIGLCERVGSNDIGTGQQPTRMMMMIIIMMLMAIVMMCIMLIMTMMGWQEVSQTA